MDLIHEWGISVIAWLQNLGDWLTTPMQIFTFLGNEEFYLLVLPVILWCVDVGLGIRIGLILLFSSVSNSLLKAAFGLPRPFWLSTEIKALASGSTYGLPSGHSQTALVLWGRVAAWFGNKWGYLIFGFLILMISLSRILLGVHFPSDVLVGWLIGGVLLLLFIKLDDQIRTRLQDLNIQWQIGIALIAALVILGLGAVVQGATAERELPQSWIDTAAAARPGDPPIKPDNIGDIISIAGTLFGVAAGGSLLISWGGFSARGTWDKRGLRYIVGVIGVVILFFGLRAIFPKGDALLPQILRCIRYAVVGFWVAYLAPRLFVALNLAESPSSNNTN
jgi:membrane-associated phospholipid phosphatase